MPNPRTELAKYWYIITDFLSGLKSSRGGQPPPPPDPPEPPFHYTPCFNSLTFLLINIQENRCLFTK